MSRTWARREPLSRRTSSRPDRTERLKCGTPARRNLRTPLSSAKPDRTRRRACAPRQARSSRPPSRKTCAARRAVVSVTPLCRTHTRIWTWAEHHAGTGTSPAGCYGSRCGHACEVRRRRGVRERPRGIETGARGWTGGWAVEVWVWAGAWSRRAVRVRTPLDGGRRVDKFWGARSTSPKRCCSRRRKRMCRGLAPPVVVVGFLLLVHALPF